MWIHGKNHAKASQTFLEKPEMRNRPRFLLFLNKFILTPVGNIRDSAITNIPHPSTLSFPRAFGGNPGFKAGCPTESFGHDRRVNGISANSKSLSSGYKHIDG